MTKLPFLTADLPGIGGVLKRHPEDFAVEELPLYEPSGAGTHVYFVIEKTGLTTDRAIDEIAAALGVKRRDLGYAGLKDAHAVTRQTLSVEHVDPGVIEQLNVPRVRILSVARHTNKLKLGHLAGNHFTIKVRDANEGAQERITGVLEVLCQRGLPNFFGPQRFGLRGDNDRIGLEIVRGHYGEAMALMLGRPDESDQGGVLKARRQFDDGDYRSASKSWPWAFKEQRQACQAMSRFGGSAKKAWRSLNWRTRRLYLSAMQSELFNRVVARRLDTIDRLLPGDLAYKHGGGAVFRVTDAQVEQARCEAFEISASGPLYGRRMTEPEHEPGRIEQQVLAEAGLSVERLRDEACERMDGARRPLRVRPVDAAFESGEDSRGPYLELRFTLPPGSYATTLLREVCK